MTELLAAVKKVFPKVAPKVGGVGGGTCGAYFRRAGIPAHMPNEYTKIEHLLNEAKVFALMMLGR